MANGYAFVTEFVGAVLLAAATDIGKDAILAGAKRGVAGIRRWWPRRRTVDEAELPPVDEQGVPDLHRQLVAVLRTHDVEPAEADRLAAALARAWPRRGASAAEARSVPPPRRAAEDRGTRERLDPFLLPSATTSRFLLLIALTLVTAGSVAMDLFALLPGGSMQRIGACAESARTAAATATPDVVVTGFGGVASARWAV